MINILAIFIGGGVGSLFRYWISQLLKTYSISFPVATLSINILGSFILGFAAAYFWTKAPDTVLHNTLKLAITIGFCGGLTTFSTFSWETFDLIKNGEFLLAGLYAIISVVVCVIGVSLGAFLTKYV